MQMFILKMASTTINPFWLRKYYNKTVSSVVDNDSRIKVGDDYLNFTDTRLPIGTEVVVEIGAKFICYSSDEYANKQSTIQHEAAALKSELLKKKLLAVTKSKEFHQSIHLPFQYDVGIKDVLTGLSENSNGDGMNKRTVYHVRLKEGFTDGKLVRKVNDFLCTSKSTDNGLAWNNDYPETLDGQVPQIITCKKCLKLMSRFH